MNLARRSFGKGAQVSLFTLGTMRALDSQESMYCVLKEACLAGINHIETAPAYGNAQSYLGQALKQLRYEGIEPEDGWIITSKILPGINLVEGKKQLKDTLKSLGLKRLSNLAIHGLNLYEHLTWALKGDGKKLLHWAQAQNLITQFGFTSHGSFPLIEDAIKSNQFKDKLLEIPPFPLESETFQDSILSQNGGDLGYFSFGDLEPEFENAAFSLNEGEISDPIKTRFGYSIIQLIDRWIEPIITEDDFQLHKHELITILRQRSAQLLRKTYVENLIKEIKFNISDNHIQLLYGNLTEALLDKSHFSLPIKLTSNNIIWNYEDIIYRLNNLSIQHLNRINSKSDLLEVLKGIFVREQIAQNAKNKEWFNKTWIT